MCAGNPLLEELLDGLVSQSFRYTTTVCAYLRALQNTDFDAEKLAEKQTSRTLVHNATIDAINVLARTMKRQGRDSRWIRPVVAERRAGYGKFAILLAFEQLEGQKGKHE